MYYILKRYNNNNDNNNVLNTVLNTVRIIKSFSVKSEKCNTLDAFMEIVRREHISFSDGVIWALEEFNQRHTPANPQPTLDRILRTNMPVKPNTECFVEGCKAKSKYQVVLRNFKGEEQTFNVCKLHRRWKHPEFKYPIRAKRLF